MDFFQTVKVSARRTFDLCLEMMRLLRKGKKSRDNAFESRILTSTASELSLFTGDVLVEKPTIKRCAHYSKGYVRGLPEGQKPSLKQLQKAQELGIVLLPGTTYVQPYTTH